MAVYITSPLDSFTLDAQANGPLTSENVFDYFATSMFYDKQSNNQVLRMQTIHTGLPLVNEAEELKCVSVSCHAMNPLIALSHAVL